ncbi:MAG: M20/M25/M40 family metallo-hydrolase [Planctomycetota bacterium]|nr:M20/M25/M40 family metallo-hydrolase [Planctomycetota bacterium]
MADEHPTTDEEAPKANPLASHPGKKSKLMARVLPVLILFSLCLLLCARQSAAPAPVSAAAYRAHKQLESLIGDDEPHPSGSRKQARVGDELIAKLKELGYSVETQRATRLNRRKKQVKLRNIFARLKGNGDLGALMLASHYDSVSRGPGAGDAGASVASILEIARIMQQRPTPNHDIVFLLTDGEEIGLLGAKLFCEEHPWAKEIKAVINLEARGNSGQSLMFESSEQNKTLIENYARGISRPATGSLFYTVYKQLPNDTDLTVFKAHGMIGYGFAFIGDAQNYHSPNDTVANLSLSSLQHQGQNALDLLDALDQNTGPLTADEDAVFFDILGLATIWWPESLTPFLALLCLLPLGLAGRAQYQSSESPLKASLWALLFLILLFVIPIALSLALKFPKLRAKAIEVWPENPEGTLWIHRGLVILCFAALATLLRNKLTDTGSFWAVTLSWTAMSLVLAFLAPATSYLFLIPVMALGIVLVPILAMKWNSRGRLIALLPMSGAAFCLWLPLEWLMYDALGLAVTTLVPFRAAVLASLFLPVFSRELVAKTAE